MQIWAGSGTSALTICNYSQILYQFLTFTQNLKRSPRIAAKDYNIALGESILLDVTDFSRIDYESVFTRISGL